MAGEKGQKKRFWSVEDPTLSPRNRQLATICTAARGTSLALTAHAGLSPNALTDVNRHEARMQRLTPLQITLSNETPGGEVQTLIADADKRAEIISGLRGEDRIPGFVSSQGLIAWRFLQSVRSHVGPREQRFCEWGSGVGIVSCLAAQQGWTSVGIEIEPRLVAEARSLADRHGLAVRFVEGSYKPPAFFEQYAPATSFNIADGVGLFDADVIFIYAWPAERDSVTEAIARHAAPGTVFMRYGGGVTCDAFRVGVS